MTEPDLDFTSVFAWQCESCHQLVLSPQEYGDRSDPPTLIKVLIPGPMVEFISGPVKAPFIERLMVVCTPCLEKIRWPSRR